MRKKFIYSIIGIFTCAYTHAQSFCSQVQPVGTYYEDTIKSPGTYYFSAMTFDLPMDVSFTSLDPNCSEVPQIWADLTCTPGIYSDPNIQALVKDTVKYGVSVPMSITCQTDTIDGHYVHHLKLGKSYKNKLQLVGVDYSVPAYVKVILPCGGVAHMEQDTSSQACINDARRIALTDGTRVLANDSLSTYILPFKTWLTETDSVALAWEGPEPAHIWLNGNNCEFEIDVQHSWDNFIIPANGEVHLPKDYLNLGVKEVQDTAGYLFAKIFSPEEGTFSSRPLVLETKGATLLRYDQTQIVTVSDTSFYCFPIDWTTVEWVANTRKIVKLYLHTSPETAPIDSFKFDLQDSVRRVLTWSKSEMKRFSAQANGQLLFVRFDCSKEEFKLTPSPMSNSVYCDINTIRLRTGVTEISGKSQHYALYYKDIEGDSLQIICNNNKSTDIQNLFIADTCEFTMRWDMTSTVVRCVEKNLRTPRGGGTFTFDSTAIAGWASKVTPDGYLYVRTTADGTITFISNKPEEQDPEGEDPEYPEIPTGMDNSSPERDYQKILHNGQIFIIRAGKTYTITGQVVKIE